MTNDKDKRDHQDTGTTELDSETRPKVAQASQQTPESKTQDSASLEQPEQEQSGLDQAELDQPELDQAELDLIDPNMLHIVGVKFRRAGKTYEFEAGTLRFKIGEKVVVETDKGLGLGRVVTPIKSIDPAEVKREIKRVVRKANWNDLQRDGKNKDREKEAFEFSLRRIKERNLDMKLVSVEYFHDASKAIFYFCAEQRVDFRELVKDLAHHLHTRIEMKQIGVRDESKILGGLGNCGQPLCCTTFLTDFTPVSVRMAKDQNLAMNPAKVSGLCGRLMCCLAYEHGMYEKELKSMPKKGKRCVCPHGRGKVTDLNVLQRTCCVELETGVSMVLDCDEVKPDTQPPDKQGTKPAPKQAPKQAKPTRSSRSPRPKHKGDKKDRPRRQNRERKPKPQ